MFFVMKTRNEVAQDWKMRGFSCGLWFDPPGQKWENYRHGTDELIYVLEGTLELEVSGQRRILNKGEEAVVPAHANHSVHNIGGCEAQWLYGYQIH